MLNYQLNHYHLILLINRIAQIPKFLNLHKFVSKWKITTFIEKLKKSIIPLWRLELKAEPFISFLHGGLYNHQVVNWGVKSSLVYPLQVHGIKANGSQTYFVGTNLHLPSPLQSGSTAFLLQNFAQISQFWTSIIYFFFPCNQTHTSGTHKTSVLSSFWSAYQRNRTVEGVHKHTFLCCPGQQNQRTGVYFKSFKKRKSLVSSWSPSTYWHSSCAKCDSSEAAFCQGCSAGSQRRTPCSLLGILWKEPAEWVQEALIPPCWAFGAFLASSVPWSWWTSCVRPSVSSIFPYVEVSSVQIIPDTKTPFPPV